MAQPEMMEASRSMAHLSISDGQCAQDGHTCVEPQQLPLVFMDLLSDYASCDTILVDGDMLLIHLLLTKNRLGTNKTTKTSKSETEATTAQVLPVVHLFETFLHRLVQQGANVKVIFFREHRRLFVEFPSFMAVRECLTAFVATAVADYKNVSVSVDEYRHFREESWLQEYRAIGPSFYMMVGGRLMSPQLTAYVRFYVLALLAEHRQAVVFPDRAVFRGHHVWAFGYRPSVGNQECAKVLLGLSPRLAAETASQRPEDDGAKAPVVASTPASSWLDLLNKQLQCFEETTISPSLSDFLEALLPKVKGLSKDMAKQAVIGVLTAAVAQRMSSRSASSPQSLNGMLELFVVHTILLSPRVTPLAFRWLQGSPSFDAQTSACVAQIMQSFVVALRFEGAVASSQPSDPEGEDAAAAAAAALADAFDLRFFLQLVTFAKESGIENAEGLAQCLPASAAAECRRALQFLADEGLGSASSSAWQLPQVDWCHDSRSCEADADAGSGESALPFQCKGGNPLLNVLSPEVGENGADATMEHNAWPASQEVYDWYAGKEMEFCIEEGITEHYRVDSDDEGEGDADDEEAMRDAIRGSPGFQKWVSASKDKAARGKRSVFSFVNERNQVALAKRDKMLLDVYQERLQKRMASRKQRKATETEKFAKSLGSSRHSRVPIAPSSTLTEAQMFGEKVAKAAPSAASGADASGADKKHAGKGKPDPRAAAKQAGKKATDKPNKKDKPKKLSKADKLRLQNSTRRFAEMLKERESKLKNISSKKEDQLLKFAEALETDVAARLMEMLDVKKVDDLRWPTLWFTAKRKLLKRMSADSQKEAAALVRFVGETKREAAKKAPDLGKEFGKFYEGVGAELKHFEEALQKALAKQQESGSSLRRLQMKTMGHHFQRERGEQDPKNRVPFRPDDWQVDMLEAVDARRSALVVAPTSAGKTFVSFYCMERVLAESADGVVVYLAPTKSLVNQVAAEVYARFRSYMVSRGLTLYSKLTNDWHDNHPLKSRVLVTLPETLDLLLLSPSPANREWARRIRYVIFDEIHNLSTDENGAYWERQLKLIRCPFLALSATVGNPEQLRRWASAFTSRKHRMLRERGRKLDCADAEEDQEVALIVYRERYADFEQYVFLPHVDGATLAPAHAPAHAHAETDAARRTPPAPTSAAGASQAELVARATQTAAAHFQSMTSAHLPVEDEKDAKKREKKQKKEKEKEEKRKKKEKKKKKKEGGGERRHGGDQEDHDGEDDEQEQEEAEEEEEEEKGEDAGEEEGSMEHAGWRLAPFHPLETVSVRALQHGFPEALKLTAADSCRLYEALERTWRQQKGQVQEAEVVRQVDDWMQRLSPEKFFEDGREQWELPSRNQGLAYEREIKQLLLLWCSSPSLRPLAERTLSQLRGGCSKELLLRESLTEEALTCNTLALLSVLESREMLPALVFSLDRRLCHDMMVAVTEALEAAEERCRGPGYADMVQREQEQLEKLRRQRAAQDKKKKKNKRRGEDDDVGDGGGGEGGGGEGEDQGFEDDFPFTFRRTEVDETFTFLPAPLSGSLARIEEALQDFGNRWRADDIRIRALKRGIAYHHEGLSRGYRSLVELLFRQGVLRCVFATATLSQGVHMPCRTVALAGDSSALDVLNFHQMIGRAGRRGFDLHGNVVFFGLPRAKMQALLTAELPYIRGHFPAQPTNLLRSAMLCGQLRDRAAGAAQGRGGGGNHTQAQQQEPSPGAPRLEELPEGPEKEEAVLAEEALVSLCKDPLFTAAGGAALADKEKAAGSPAPDLPPQTGGAEQAPARAPKASALLCAWDNALAERQIDHFQRFSVSMLERCGMLDAEGRTRGLSALASQLFAQEPANVLLCWLLGRGSLQRAVLEGAGGPEEAPARFIWVMATLFSRLPFRGSPHGASSTPSSASHSDAASGSDPEAAVDGANQSQSQSSQASASDVLEHTGESHRSFGVLPPLSAMGDAGKALEEDLRAFHKEQIAAVRAYAAKFVADTLAVSSSAARLPISGVAVGGGSQDGRSSSHNNNSNNAAEGPWMERLRGLTLPRAPTVRSPLSAVAGWDDEALVRERDASLALLLTARSELYLEELCLPMFEYGDELTFNAFALDFFHHGKKALLVKHNGLLEGEAWALCQGFYLSLKAVKGAFRRMADLGKEVFDIDERLIAAVKAAEDGFKTKFYRFNKEEE